MPTRHILSIIYCDAIQRLNNIYHRVSSTSATAPLSGYVHLLNQGNAIFITDERQPYLVTIESTLFHKLKTGDRLQARVTYNADSHNDIVSEIIDVQHVTYDDAPVVKSNRSLDLCGNTINLGTSLLVHVEDNTDIVDKVDRIRRALPTDITPILLSFDGRPTNFEIETAYFTKPSYTSREKLMTCLLAFFRAKQQADIGKNIVLIIDSLDKMFLTYNNCMQSAGTFDPNLFSSAAVMDFENILCSSGNLKAGGSLTIIGLHHSGTSPQLLQINDRLHQIMDKVIKL